MQLQLIATCAFGLEAVVKRELRALGYEARTVRPGRLAFAGDPAAVCRANLWLRSADRVLVQLAEIACVDFDALFETVGGLPWEAWIATDAAIPVRGRSHKSQLESVPACQRTVKKAIVERMLQAGGATELPETGPAAPVEVSLVEDRATIDLDASGDGLHRRGYRKLAAKAQLRETLAAALVQLSYYRSDRPLIDPFCGTGTIVIEAALLGRNLAPGRNRTFAAEHYAPIEPGDWARAREEAADLSKPQLEQPVIGWDADAEALKLARFHAAEAGVEEDVHLQQREFADLSSKRKYGSVVTNPPYGMRMGDDEEVERLYRDFPRVLRRLPTWSHFLLSARSDLERLVGQTADRRRKLYNGPIECTYYQFFGPKPPRGGDRRVGESFDEAGPSRSPTPVDWDGGLAGDDNSPTLRGHVSPTLASDEMTALQREEATAMRSDESPAQDVKRPPEKDSHRPKPAFGGLRDEAVRQAEELSNRLHKRARHLRRWPTKRGITCYRLYDRDVPDVPLAIDRYDNALHIAEYERPHDRTPAEHADWLDHMVQATAKALDVPRADVFVKHRARQRGRAQYERLDDRRAERIVQEGGLKFRVNLSDYLDTGLFLDHRVARSMVRDTAEGMTVLNLFCYTGAFTVYAAAGGAAETTSVDLSPNYVEWARENLRLNGFDEPAHRVIQSDVGAYLRSLRGRPHFDLAIVDPPTFSNSKRVGEDWNVQRDHAALLNRLFEGMKPRGVVFFATNSRRFKLDETALGGVTIREISRQTVPEDFRNKRIHRCWRIVLGGSP